MSRTYLFYDLETSGLNKCFDQVLQFAAIRTDTELNIIAQHEIFIKLNPDVILSPTALLTHQLPLEQIQQGVCEYTAIQEIHRLFNTPDTITIGYNTLGFDDEFLRFSFWRNLLDPYTHQYANNCSRMDLYPIVVMYYLFKPEIMAWPHINGEITFKLEHLAHYNKLTSGTAHNAMHDVHTSWQLAKLLKQEHDMWEYLEGYFIKKIDMKRLKKIPVMNNQYPLALLIDGILGRANIFQTSCLGLGFHQHYKNQTLWLPLDAFAFNTVNTKNLAQTTYVQRKRFGESPILLPCTGRFNKHLTTKRLAMIDANLSWINKHHDLFTEIANYHLTYKYPEIPNLDSDAALYQAGFMHENMRLQCAKFHSASSEEKISMLDKFTTSNLRTQALRIFGRNYPDILVRYPVLAQEFAYYLQKIKTGEKLTNYKNELRLTPQAALAEITNLQHTTSLTPKQQDLLLELTKYIQSW